MMCSTRRRGQSWGLLILGILSVLAPVWASVYVCPMERAGDEQILSTCCAQADASASQAKARFEPSCDCPRVVWQGGETDLVRGFQASSLDVSIQAVLPWFRESRIAPASVPPDLRERVSALPPLWMRNLSIRC